MEWNNKAYLRGTPDRQAAVTADKDQDQMFDCMSFAYVAPNGDIRIQGVRDHIDCATQHRHITQAANTATLVDGRSVQTALRKLGKAA